MVQLNHEVLQSVLKPSRYTGGEWNAVVKDWDKVDCTFALALPDVYLTLPFLALIASLGCFLAWNIVCKRVTVVVASNYLYFNPVTSLLAGALLLDERITWPAIIGCIVTIAGVYLCNTKLQRTPSVQD